MFTLRLVLGTAVMAFSMTVTVTAADLIYTPRSNPRDAQTAVATSQGRPLITKHDMVQSNSIQYYNLARQLHRQHTQWLRQTIEERLLETEAAKRGVTILQLFDQVAKPEPVTEGIIAQFLSERGRPGGKLTDEERKFLEDERNLVARREYREKLYTEAKIQINLPEPELPQVLVSEGNSSPVLGIADGPVNIVEFCAFTSVHCKTVWTTLRELVKKHGWRVRIVHRDFPVANAPASMTAALAARCAHRQQKFWPYHDYLYDNQDRLDPESLKGYAKHLGLDAAKFNQCLDNKETAQEIEWDLLEGRRVRLSTLPSLFANTIYLPADLPAEKLVQLIESRLGQ